MLGSCSQKEVVQYQSVSAEAGSMDLPVLVPRRVSLAEAPMVEVLEVPRNVL